MSGVISRNSCLQIWWLVDGKRQWATLNKKTHTMREAKREAYRREIEGRVIAPKVYAFRDVAETFFANRAVSASTSYKIKKFVDVFEAFLQERGYGTNVSGITEAIVREYLTE